MKKHIKIGLRAKAGFYVLLLASGMHICPAATFVWNGGGVDANWSTVANWSGGVVPANNGTATIVLAGTSQLAPNVDIAWNIASLTFSNNAGAFVLGGSALTLSAGGITNNSANGQIIGNAIALGINQTWNSASNMLAFNGNITNGTSLLTVSGNFSASLNGIISGLGGLTKSGTGTLILSGANTYTGLTTISAGVLNLQNGSALGGGSGGTTVASGAQLQLSGGITVTGKNLTLSGTGLANSGALRSLSGSNTWSGTITLAAASTLAADAGTLNLTTSLANSTFLSTFINNGTILLNGVLGGGTGGLTKTGTGLLQLNGANTYTGTTTVSGGTVQFGATGSLSGTTAVTINAAGTLDLNGIDESILSLAGAGSVTLGGGTLTVNNTAATTFSGVISEAGNLVDAGPATFTLSGANTYTGSTTINVGALSIATAAGLGNVANTLNLNGGTLTTTATLTLAQAISLGSGGGIFNPGATTLMLSGTISGPGGMNLLGPGTLALTGSNSYLGGTTYGSGTITIGADAALGDSGGTVNFTNSATLATTGSFNSTRAFNLSAGTATFSAGAGFTNAFTGVISGAGAVTKTGAGTLILSGMNAYAGLTTVSTGALNIQNSSALGSGNSGTTVASGAQLQLQGGITVTGKTLTLSGTGINNSGALRNASGSNTWNGAITLAAASTIGADADTLNLQGNILNSTFLATFTNNGTILLNGTLGGGTGGLTKIGTGLLQLNAPNTYTGATTVSGGTLQFGATGSASSASAVTVNAGTTLDLNGFNQSILSLAGTNSSVTLGGGTLTVNNSAATTFAGVISEAGDLIKAAGAGTLTLSGVNTFNGGVTINAGAISIAANTGLGNATNALTLDGGTLTTSGSAFTSARTITLGAGNGGFNIGGTSLTLSGTISGPGALTKLGSKILILNGTNNYLGGTTNTAGTLTVNSDVALGDAGSPFTFATNSTLTTTKSFTSARNFSLNAGTATFSCGTGFTNTFNGVISGPGALTQSGAGVMMLGGNNTFTNLLAISAGTVRLGGSGGISALSPVVIGKTTAILDLNNFNATIGSLGSTAVGKVTLGSGFLTAGGNNLSRTNSAVISGTGGFTKVGTGTQTFSSANTYTGTTTIGAGTLQISASERLANTSPLVVSNSATFNLNNFNETVASLAGGGNVTLGTGTLTAGNTSTTTFSGSISGTGAFTKAATGMQIFSGPNTYSGATTVSAGNLQVNSSSPNSAVTVASAATFSGSGVVATVAVNSGGTNAPGAGRPGILTSGSQTWSGGGNYAWEINDPAGNQGGSAGWDGLNILGTLVLNATAASKFKLKIISLTPANAAGLLTNFDNTATYVWTIASASGGITGFNPAYFNLDTSAFQNSLGAGKFALSQSGNDLNLSFTTAAAAAVKGVQSGTLTSTGNGTITSTLATPVNPTNAFLIFNTRNNSSVPGGTMLRGSLTSSNSVEFVRATAETSTMNIQWYVVEYAAGVRVQRGEVNQTNTLINVPLAPLSATNRTFVIWSKSADPAATAFSDSDPVVGQITSVSNLQLRVTSAPSSVPVISWQVIEFQNPASIGVQQGSVTNLTGTNLTATATLSAPINTNSTFILTGYRTSGSGTSVGARLLRAQLTGASTITFDRSISGTPDDIAEIAWQAVQLNDGSVAQSGSVNFPGGVAQTNVTLASLNTNRAVAFSSVQPAGGQNTGRSPSTGNVPGVGAATLAVTDGTQATLERNNTSAACDVGWFVMGFGAGSLLTPATGGAVISADTTTNTFTSLTGPVYTEAENGNVGVGTIILKCPAGFNFDTNGPLPTVIIDDGSDISSQNINGVANGTAVAMTSVNKTNLTFTVTSASSGGATCSLTWQNLRVFPTAGTPLASSNLVSLGTSFIQGVTTNSTSWGLLTEVVGVPTKLGLTIVPASTAVAGVDFAQQPVIQVQDRFGNLRTADNATVVTVTNTGTTVLEGATDLTVVGGVAAFTGLDYTVAETIKLGFGATGLTGTNSGNIVVSAAAANQVTVVTQPSATATAGIKFAQQSVAQVQDAYGNLIKTDTSTVTAVINQGSGTLSGTLAIKAVAGVATFTNLSYPIAETITIDFTDGSLDPDTSTGTAVGAAAASQLVIQAQPSAVAAAGVPFAHQPVIQILDLFGNLCVTNSSTVVTASRNAGSGAGSLQGVVPVAAVNGVVTYANLAHNVAGTISLDFNGGGLTGATSSGITINPAAVAALVFTTQPGSATVGSIFGIKPVVITQDAYGNNSVSGLTSSLPVNLVLTSGTGTLQGTTNLNIGTAAGNGTVMFTNLRIDSAGSKQLTASASGLTGTVSSSFNVAQASQTITFGVLSNQTYGVAPVAVSASASSALPVTFGIVSGPASISSNLLSITGAGLVTVSASQPGNSNYLMATTMNQSFTVTQAVLTVTANSTNRIYGAANPVFTAGYAGFVNGDAMEVASGVPAFGTPATGTSSVVGSPYAIAVTNGTLSAINYSFRFVNGQLTITSAGSALAVGTSANPSPTGSNVTFTATVTADSPDSGTPTGTVQFLADGAALGSPAALGGGVANVTTASLANGPHTISARYAGDGNFLGRTNSLSPNELINTSPVAGNVTLYRNPVLIEKVRLATLLTNASDADGNALTLIVNPISASNAPVTVSGSWVIYTPPAGFTNADAFTYTVTDSYGAGATGTVTMAILEDNSQSQNLTVTTLDNGASFIDFNGVPGRTYSIQSTTNLQTVPWQTLGIATADTFGKFGFTDLPPTNSPPRFYRSTYP